ncbi:integrase, catalytic region, zinc finger, CCHC-type containing protein [Tanacetum coccineum]
MLSFIGVKPSTSASGSQPSGNIKKDKILKTQHSKLNANSELLCVKCNGCMLYDNHDLCVLDFINDVNARAKSKSVKKSSKEKSYVKPTGKGLRIWIHLETYWKHRKSKTNVPVSKPKIIKSISANNKEPSKSWGSIVSDVPSSSLDECRLSKLFYGTVKFGNDQVAKILGYGDYQIGNVTISRVYYVEGLGYNLFSVGQLSDSNLEVAFRQHTCFIRNLEGVDLLTGSRGNNLYTLSLGDTMASSLICLLSNASKTKSWLWHRRLSHLNFGTINHLARHGLVREAVATACYTQNRSIIRLRHGKTPYELLHDKLPDLSFFHVFGALCYPTNDSENLGKLQPKADIGIFIGYAPTKKAFRIYNRRTRRIIKTIHVDFDELTAMASEHSSLEPALHEMTPATISSGLVPNPPPFYFNTNLYHIKN